MWCFKKNYGTVEMRTFDRDPIFFKLHPNLNLAYRPKTCTWESEKINEEEFGQEFQDKVEQEKKQFKQLLEQKRQKEDDKEREFRLLLQKYQKCNEDLLNEQSQLEATIQQLRKKKLLIQVENELFNKMIKELEDQYNNIADYDFEHIDEISLSESENEKEEHKKENKQSSK